MVGSFEILLPLFANIWEERITYIPAIENYENYENYRSSSTHFVSANRCTEDSTARDYTSSV